MPDGVTVEGVAMERPIEDATLPTGSSRSRPRPS
jgi:hypothetical protein